MTAQSKEDFWGAALSAAPRWNNANGSTFADSISTRGEPHLGADGVLGIATDLWERPDCQLVTPELAVGLLFSDHLPCLSCFSRGHADFSSCAVVQRPTVVRPKDSRSPIDNSARQLEAKSRSKRDDLRFITKVVPVWVWATVGKAAVTYSIVWPMSDRNSPAC